MEKTMARTIYKRMELGKSYKTYELFKLLSEEEYYGFIPVELQGKDVGKVVAAEMWKVVNAGYATTSVGEETYHIVRGCRYGKTDWSKVPTQTYSCRYWVRTK